MTRRETSLTVQAAAYSGPLPPPEALARYNEILPGAADRIIAMAERQSQHREEIETAVINGNIQEQKRGTRYGFIIAMTVAIGSIYLLATGHAITGSITLFSDLGSLVGVFVYGKKQQREELGKKSDALAKRMNRG